MGASAGGVPALCEVVAGLPRDLPAAVFIVLHISPHPNSALPTILNRCGKLPASHPEDGAAIEPGRIYVAPPDRHLTIDDSRVCVSRTPKENGHRPALDVLFRSAARHHRRRVVGVVLTGNLDDGTAGLLAIKRHGGIAVVQDPATADYPGMPTSAIETVEVDHVLPLTLIPQLLTDLAHQPVEEKEEEEVAVPDDPSDRLANLDVGGGNAAEGYGLPSGVTCPECHGTLYDRRDEAGIGFICRVGHAYSPESLVAAKSEEIDSALWAAVRALEESAALSRRLQRRMEDIGKGGMERRYAERANDAERYADVLRKILIEDTAKAKTG
jgi:two-component system chemotaxis response regulator CheB